MSFSMASKGKNWNFQRRCGFLEKIHFMVEVWLFSGAKKSCHDNFPRKQKFEIVSAKLLEMVPRGNEQQEV